MTEIGFFDAQAELDRSGRYLPHWFQPGVATFVTFRTADSMPVAVVRRWHEEAVAWLRERGIAVPPGGPLPDPDRLPQVLRAEYRTHRTGRWHWHLDSCHGRCELRDPRLGAIVLDSLRHFDGARYDLDCAVVMPNHVHLLCQFRAGTTCQAQCESWLHYTAWQINKQLGRKGAYWQAEPFDHLVRSGAQFEYLQRYVANNGSSAGLPATDYLFWKRT